jgi:hypothetical protein
VNNGLVPGDWATFFLAAAVVGAVVAGTVAASLTPHLARIIVVPGGVARAAEAVLVPVLLTLVGFAGLWPADSWPRVGIAITVVAGAGWLVLVGLLLRGGSVGASVPDGTRSRPDEEPRTLSAEPRTTGAEPRTTGADRRTPSTGAALVSTAPTIPRRALPRAVVDQLVTLPLLAGGLLLATGTIPGLDLALIGVGASVVGGLWLAALLSLDVTRIGSRKVPPDQAQQP